jgi:hypothetical protein
MVAVAKRALPKPSWKPIATDNAVTVAECDDGMQPEPISCLGSHLFSLYLCFRNNIHIKPIAEKLTDENESRKSLLI